MDSINNHLSTALSIVKEAIVQVKTTTSSPIMSKDGSNIKLRNQNEIDKAFQNFNVPRPDSNEMRVVPGGLIGMLPGVPSSTVTLREAELLDTLNFGDKVQLNGIRNEAYAVSGEQFPENSLEDGPGDAFRHAYASALMSREFGPDFAKDFTDAHEALPGRGNDKGRAFMDLHNNQQGIAIALANPNSTDAELQSLIKADIQKGEMVTLDKGKPVFSSHYYGEFGGTPIKVEEPVKVQEHKSSADERQEEAERNRAGHENPGSDAGTEELSGYAG